MGCGAVLACPTPAFPLRRLRLPVSSHRFVGVAALFCVLQVAEEVEPAHHEDEGEGALEEERRLERDHASGHQSGSAANMNALWANSLGRAKPLRVQSGSMLATSVSLGWFNSLAVGNLP